MTFEEMLLPLMEAKGAIAAAFVDAQGETIACSGDVLALEVLGAYHPLWIAGIAGAAARGGIGGLVDLEIEFARRRVLASSVKDGAFVLVVFDISSVPALARARLPAARERFAAEME